MSGSVWKYNMRTHLTKYHPSICDTDILQACIIIHSSRQALFCASTTWPLSTPDNAANLDTLQLDEAEALNECEAEETSSESETDSEGDEDSKEMETEEQYAGEEEDEPDSYEENHIPTSIFLAPTSPNVEELEATAEVNTVMNVDIDAPASLDTPINHLDEPTLSHDMMEVSQLLTINQTEFMIDAELTQQGWTRRTQDMMEVTACICGIPVDSSSRNSNVAIQCGYKGCETLWFHLDCLNFDVAKLALFEPCSTH
ncbi:hypothetical protein L208DRAFT_1375605 [Tricholoma matsutake]|nr:hypothetical protein L208DRAFT_1375605 [Tricholoma matsutake 945]